MKNLSSKLALTAICLGITTSGYAGPGDPGPHPVLGIPPAGGIHGESVFVDNTATSPADEFVHIDWSVYSIGDAAIADFNSAYTDGYLYLFQVENATSKAIHRFTIDMTESQVGTILDGGWIRSDDLDVGSTLHGAHAPIGEAYEGAGGVMVADAPFDMSTSSVGWNFGDASIALPAPVAGDIIASGPIPFVSGSLGMTEESTTMWFISSEPPIYGNGAVINGTSWDSDNDDAQEIPVPGEIEIPEPSTYALLGISLGVASFARRRRAEV